MVSSVGATSTSRTWPATRRPASTSPGKLEKQGNLDGFVVKKDAVHALAMRAQRLSVIRHHHDQRAVI